MKKCPFCEWENEDDASKCLACGCELLVEEEKAETDISVEENGESGDSSYSVVITKIGPFTNKISKIMMEHGNATSSINGKVSPGSVEFSKVMQIVKDLKIDKLSEEQANKIAAKLRAKGACVKVMKTELVTPDFLAERKENFKKKTFWTIKLLGGQQEDKVQEFIASYFGLELVETKARIDTAVSKYTGLIISTDEKEEAENIVSKLREFGAEAEIVEEEKSSAYLPGLAKQKVVDVVGWVVMVLLILSAAWATFS